MKFAFSISVTPTTKYGVHGYDNAEKLMHAIFMAKGPLFAHGQELEPFNTVDLYNLFCRILRIECKPNEGTDRTHTWDVLLGKSSNAVPPRPRPHDVERKPGKLQHYVTLLYHKIRSIVPVLNDVKIETF